MPKIIGVGMCVPPNSFTNDQLKDVGNPIDPEWTLKTLNIESRRIATYETTLDLAARAARGALTDAHIHLVDLIIVGTTTPHRRAPSTACYLQERLGLEACPAFDMNAVCASFIYGLVLANDLMRSGKYDNILIVGADTLSKYTNWKDRNCVFFGDGAGAVVLSNHHLPSEHGILATDWDSNHGADAWTIEEDNFWHMDGPWVYKLAVKHIVDSAERCLRMAGLKVDDVDIVIPHQPGIGVLKDVAKEIGIPFEKVHTVMDKYANTSSACIPIALHDALQAGKIKKGDIVLLTGVGAGWTSASAVMEW